ncbi:protein GPR108 [Poecilia reticulata]|uniref:G protein-coupled receptor 108 n=2 Tax=Poecilia reticulata TaxID=8081 RepID=A0A3P9MSI5_POERE|nr:PREDICTED: protein GPR108 [Poecilia reticulata]
MAVPHIQLSFAVILLLVLLSGCNARKHKLSLKNEIRSAVDLNNFGFFASGTLNVSLLSLWLSDSVDYSTSPVGFSLSRSRVNGVLSYTAEETEECPLKATKTTNDEPLILFLIDSKNLGVNVKAFGVQDNYLIAKLKPEEKKVRKRADGDGKPDDANGKPSNTDPKQGKEKQETAANENPNPAGEAKKVSETKFKLNSSDERILVLDETNGSYSFSFSLEVGPKNQGLYNLKFHYCQNRGPGVKKPYNLTVDVVEKNPGGSYLSAAEIPLSRLYICMAGVFFTAAMVWVYTLMKHRYSVFKIHWLMAALAFTKSTSLVFHSINYHFINIEGHPSEGWAVMYYITHLLKGALLFITLALIGTGWAFVKYILSDKEKKIFMIVIPLQVLANVAYIIIESTEEGSSEYYLWKEILFLVDLICCGAILFPVVWSIRHLQEASSTDGKAAMNLEKLKLFRHYYVMIVCYIYFTRIIAILLKITMPFQWQWCYEFLVEVSTLIFFVLTGYKFRPASNNPYLQLPLDEEDVEMDEVVTESGALEGISKVKKTSNGRECQKEPAL